MKVSFWSLLSLLLFAMSTTQAADEPKKVRLFILSGQSNMAGLNPDLSFTPEIKKAFPADEIIVVKHALGGQPIRRWDKQWQPPEGVAAPKGMTAQTSGDIYDALMKKVNEATKDKKLTTISFVWMQGERDAKEGYSAVYADSLKRVLKQLRDDLKRPDLSFVIGRLSDNLKGQTHWDAVRALQEKVAKDDPLGTWVDTDDLNGTKNDLHYNKEGYIELGKRFATKATELIRKEEKQQK